jgi:hypothetical protein
VWLQQVLVPSIVITGVFFKFVLQLGKGSAPAPAPGLRPATPRSALATTACATYRTFHLTGPGFAQRLAGFGANAGIGHHPLRGTSAASCRRGLGACSCDGGGVALSPAVLRITTQQRQHHVGVWLACSARLVFSPRHPPDAMEHRQQTDATRPQQNNKRGTGETTRHRPYEVRKSQDTNGTGEGAGV